MPNTVSTTPNSTPLDSAIGQKVIIASDGTALVIYYDGTSMVYRSAASPYSSWSSATTLPGSGGNRFNAAAHWNSVDDSVDVIYHVSGGMPNYVKLTKSGTSWTNGTNHQVAAVAGSGSSGEAVWVGRDSGGNLWSVMLQTNTTWEAYYSTDGGTTWNASITGATMGGSSVDQPCAVMTGNYLLVCYSNNAGQLAWRRLDTTGTLTAWSAQQAVNLGPNPDFYAGDLMSIAADGHGRVIFTMSSQTFNFGSGVWAKVYTPGTDTWGSDTHLGTHTGGTFPDNWAYAVSNGTDVWVIYCHGIAANNYELDYKKWTDSTATWDSTATVLEASGSNITMPNAGFGNNTVGFAYPTGTSNPFTINFDSFSTGGGTTTKTVTDSGTGSETPSISATTAISDSGTGSETIALGTVAPSVSDSGTGSDSQSTTTFIPTDTGTGSENLAFGTITPSISDSGTGSDSQSTGTLIPDTGTGTESLSSSTTFTQNDTGAGTETYLTGIPQADSGSGTESLGSSTTFTQNDTGSGAETYLTGIPETDSGTGSDTPTISASFSPTDSGTGSDSQSTGTIIPSDPATGSESFAFGTITPSISESGTGADSVSVNQGTNPAVSDAATGTESITFGPISLTQTDSGTGGDTLVVSTAFTVNDAGTGAELISNLTTVTLSDNATGAENVSASVTMTLPVDTGSGVETISFATITIPLNDASLGSEAINFTVQPGIADTSAGTESLAIAPIVLTLTDAATGAETQTIVVTPNIQPDTAVGGDSVSVISLTVIPIAVPADTASGTEFVVRFFGTLAAFTFQAEIPGSSCVLEIPSQTALPLMLAFGGVT